MAIRIQTRGGTAAEWATADPVLADRELGVETDTRRSKIGDGVTAWASLPYMADALGEAATRTQEGTLSARPVTADDGTRYFATDDRGGTEWVTSGGVWAQAARSVNVGSLLAVAEPATNPVQAIAVENTDYRIVPLTIDFTMPAQRVLVSVSDLTVYQAGVATKPQMSIWYSINGWTAKTALDGRHNPPIPGVAPFYFNRFSVGRVMLPTSIAAGTAVSVAVFLNTATGDGTPTLTIDAVGNKPHLMAQAI